MRFIDDGAPSGTDETADGSWSTDVPASRDGALLTGTSFLDLKNQEPLLCSARDLGKDAPSGEYSLSLGGGVTGQLGFYLIGFGPYASGGASVGVTSRGMAFAQFQGVLGGGIGSFAGYGVQGGGSHSAVPLKTGWQSSTGVQFEFNFGAGTSYSLTIQVSDDNLGGQSNIPFFKLRPIFGQGIGVGASISVYSSKTFAFPIPQPEVSTISSHPLLLYTP
jgi:hypothetical protein